MHLEKMYKVDDGFYVLSTWPREDSRTGEKMMPIWRVQKDGSGKEIVGRNSRGKCGELYRYFKIRFTIPWKMHRTDGNYQFSSMADVIRRERDNKQIWQSDLYSGYIEYVAGNRRVVICK